MIAEYRELLSLTQIYLQRTYSLKSFRTTTPEAFARLNTFTLPQAKPSPQPLKVTPPPIPKIQPSPPTEKKEAPKIVSQPPPVKAEPHPLSLEPVSSPSKPDLSEFWKLHLQLFPDTKLCETIPDDAVAQKIKNSWKEDLTIPSVVILSFNEKERELTFLKNVAKAITLRFMPARVISASKWEELLNSPQLSLVIAPDHDFYMHAELMKYYKEANNLGKHYLKNSPLLLLSDPSLYLKEPQLKSLLWRAICNDFASTPHS